MKQLLSVLAITFAVIAGTTAYGRNYTPYPLKVKTKFIKDYAQGCIGAGGPRKYCWAVARCFIRKAEYNLSFKKFIYELVRVGQGKAMRPPLTTYNAECAAENAYLAF